MTSPVFAELAGCAQAAQEARDLVRDTLGEGHLSTDDAVLIDLELVSNAITHGRSRQRDGTVVLTSEQTAQPFAVCVAARDGSASRALQRQEEAVPHGIARSADRVSPANPSTNFSAHFNEDDKARRRQKGTIRMDSQQHDNYGWDINEGGPPKWWTVTWVAEELRGKIQRNGQAIADLWPKAARPAARANAEATRDDREAEP